MAYELEWQRTYTTLEWLFGPPMAELGWMLQLCDGSMPFCVRRSNPPPAADLAPPQVLGFPGSTASGVFILATTQDSQQPSPKSPPGMGSFTPAASQLRVGSTGARRVEAGSSASDRYSACCYPNSNRDPLTLTTLTLRNAWPS